MIFFITIGLFLHLCQSQKCSKDGFDFTKIAANDNYQHSWSPPGDPNPQTISYAPCSDAGGIPNGCGGSPPPTNQCYNLPGCCAVCQAWMQDTGPAGACLGVTSKLLGIRSLSSTNVIVTYGGGDPVDTTPRQVDIYIDCDPNASVLDFSNFAAPSPVDPPPPYYLFALYLNSSALCSSSNGSTCPILPGFDFDQIAASNNYQASWTSSDGFPETITYAPCTSGIGSTCGTSPMNQCANQEHCCAVCQSWIEDTGSAGSCLGLSSKLLGVKVLDPVTVTVSYGGGDMAENTPRQVDIYISCDPAASVLTFVKFIPATAQSPPPPVYLYQLFLSSNHLCYGKISELLATMGIQYP